MVRLALSAKEWAILGDIRDLGYGEVFDLPHVKESPFKVFEIDESEKKLILLLRQREIHKLVVHDGLPANAEYKATTGSGLKALQKIKF